MEFQSDLEGGSVVFLPLPSSFILGKTTVSLAELEWAFNYGLIGAQTVVDIATSMLAAGAQSGVLLDLASLSHEELPQVKELLVGYSSGVDESEIRAKWLWLVLAHLYETQGTDEGVFDKLDALYADLGYPEEMVPFGPYAPAYESKDDPQRARSQVLKEWRSYLANAEKKFGSGS
jgi:hypothetical protein